MQFLLELTLDYDSLCSSITQIFQLNSFSKYLEYNIVNCKSVFPLHISSVLYQSLFVFVLSKWTMLFSLFLTLIYFNTNLWWWDHMILGISRVPPTKVRRYEHKK